MWRSKWFVVSLVVVAALSTVACSKPPQQELDSAQAAMQAAEQSQAAKYAPEAWNQAQEQMNAAKAEIEAQNGKFVLTRSYLKAKDMLVAAQKAAEQAKDAAMTGKITAKNEAQTALDAVNAGIEKAKTLMADLEKCRRRPKGFKQDMEQMQGTLDGLQQQVSGIDSAMTSEDYLQAKSLGESLQSEVQNLVNDLESAKSKIRC